MEGAIRDLHFGIMSTFVNVKIVRFAVIVNKDRNNKKKRLRCMLSLLDIDHNHFKFNHIFLPIFMSQYLKKVTPSKIRFLKD